MTEPNGWKTLLLKVVDRIISREIIISVLVICMGAWLFYLGITKVDEALRSFNMSVQEMRLAIVQDTTQAAEHHKEDMMLMREFITSLHQREMALQAMASAVEAQTKSIDLATEATRDETKALENLLRAVERQ